MHTCPAAQVFPHAPQWVVDDCVLTHTPLHRTCAGVPPPGPPPVAGAQPQMPARQVAPPVHAMPQPPQLAESVAMFTHELPQRSSPGVQNAWHDPAEHTCPAAHALPQRPQWSSRVLVSTQAPLQ